jgi:UDP-N-acetylglucosamine:LPS N-acetylglucosamine transferase
VKFLVRIIHAVGKKQDNRLKSITNIDEAKMQSVFHEFIPQLANHAAIISLPGGERPTEAMGAVAPTILPAKYSG